MKNIAYAIKNLLRKSVLKKISVRKIETVTVIAKI